MTGVNIGGHAVPVATPTFVPISVTDETADTLTLWLCQHGETAYELPNTSVSLVTFAQLLPWPSMSPDQTTLLYDIVPQSGATNPILTTTTDPGDSPTTIASVPNGGGSGGFHISPQPSWSPDGTQVIYRHITTAPLQSIRRCDADGSNNTQLLSASTSDGTLSFPLYSPDGTRIMFVQDNGTNRRLKVMDADGTNLSTLVTMATQNGFASESPAWMHGSNVIGYYKASGEFYSINEDGTGDTMLWDDPVPFWHLTRHAWLPDDSGMIHIRWVSADPNPKGVLHVIEAAVGSTDISPEQRSWGQNDPYLPRVYGPRIWWMPNSTAANDFTISSMLPDGSDVTVEFTNTVDQGNVDFERVV